MLAPTTSITKMFVNEFRQWRNVGIFVDETNTTTNRRLNADPNDNEQVETITNFDF